MNFIKNTVKIATEKNFYKFNRKTVKIATKKNFYAFQEKNS